MLRAMVFDFDGVIADTEPLHLAAFNEVLAGDSIHIAADRYFDRYVGLNDAAFLRTVFADFDRPIDAHRLAVLNRAKDAAYFKVIAGGLELLPGVRTFIDQASTRWPLAICSGARAVEIRAILRFAGLEDRFDVVVSADDATPSKPDPASYVLAVQRLIGRHGPMRPGDCLAIEDSGHGVASAKAAGLRVLLVRGRHGAGDFTPADWVVPTLASLSAAKLEAMAE